MLQIYWLSVCFLTTCIQYSSRGSPLTGLNVKHAKRGEFSFVVSLSRNDSKNHANLEKNHHCGGTLITAKHVLTVAHCLKNVKQSNEIVIKVNNGDLLESEIYKVRKWTTYDKWAKTKFTGGSPNDIAIIELTARVSKAIKPAVITRIPEVQLYGKEAVIAGWGATDANRAPRHLSIGRVTVLKSGTCLHYWKNDGKNRKSNKTHIFMCTEADPPINVECGDSGGPLLVNGNEIIAVNKGYCRNVRGDIILHTQNVHMSVNYYIEFISHVIECEDQLCCFQ